MPNKNNMRLPEAERFLIWLIEAMEKLGVSAFRVGEIAEVSPNAVKKFINRTSREMHLTTAHKIEGAVLSLAIEQDVEILPAGASS